MNIINLGVVFRKGDITTVACSGMSFSVAFQIFKKLSTKYINGVNNPLKK